MNLRGEFEFAAVNLNLLWRIWTCRGQFKFIVVNLSLLWLICRSELEIAAMNLNLPGEFGSAELNLLW